MIARVVRHEQHGTWAGLMSRADHSFPHPPTRGSASQPRPPAASTARAPEHASCLAGRAETVDQERAVSVWGDKAPARVLERGAAPAQDATHIMWRVLSELARTGRHARGLATRRRRGDRAIGDTRLSSRHARPNSRLELRKSYAHLSVYLCRAHVSGSRAPLSAARLAATPPPCRAPPRSLADAQARSQPHTQQSHE